MKFALISALVVAAVPAFADITSPAEAAAKHDFATNFVTDKNLGKTSPAEIADNDYASNDVVSTQNLNDLIKLGVTSPAELAARD